MGNARRVAILGYALVGLAELLKERGFDTEYGLNGILVSDKIGNGDTLWNGAAVARYKSMPLDHLDYGTRIHPKLAHCTTRRRGRKCKKSRGRPK